MLGLESYLNSFNFSCFTLSKTCFGSLESDIFLLVSMFSKAEAKSSFVTFLFRVLKNGMFTSLV
jgi:hypothetical protein